MVANHDECTLALLRYSLGGNRPSQTDHITSPTQNNTSAEYIQENYDLRRFLEEAPPLRKVVYGIDATTYYSSKDTEEIRKAKKGKHVFYEGSWQPNTFYDKILDDLPGREFAIEHKGFVVGRKDYIFQLVTGEGIPNSRAGLRRIKNHNGQHPNY